MKCLALETISYPDAVRKDVVWVVKDVPGELVVHTKPIEEVLCRERRKPNLDAEFRFECTYCRFDLSLLELLSSDDEVEPAVELASKDACDHDDVELPRLPHMTHHGLAIKRRRIKKKTLERDEM